MQVGDLVKHSGMNDVAWYGVITKKSEESKSNLGIEPERLCVIWTFGVEGWFYSHDLEVVCK